MKEIIRQVLKKKASPGYVKLMWYLCDLYNNPRGAEVIVSTTHLKNVLGLRTPIYKPVLDYFLSPLSETWSYSEGKAKTYVWKPSAQIFAQFKNSPPQLEQWKQLYASIVVESITPPVIPIDGNVTDWHRRPFYHQTPNSYRLWHPLQNLPKRVMQEAYRGASNWDLVGAYGSIFWWDLGGKESVLSTIGLFDPQARTQNINTVIAREFPNKTTREHKQMRNSLFFRNVKNPAHRTGSDILNQVCIEIGIVIGRDPLLKLSQIERGLVDKVGKVSPHYLRMHDGSVTAPLSDRKKRDIEDVLYPHRVKFETY